MILSEIGEDRSGETTAGHTVLRQSMGTHLHGRQMGTTACRLRQLGLQTIRERRGVGGGDAVPGPPVYQRAEQCCGLTHLPRKVLDQMGGGGLAVGACDPDQRHPSAGMVPERSRQIAHDPGDGVLNHHHRVASSRRVLACSSRSDHRRCSAALERLPPETATIHPLTRQTQKQGPSANRTGIAGDGRQRWIVQPLGDGQSHLLQKGMQRLTHGVPDWAPEF